MIERITTGDIPTCNNVSQSKVSEAKRIHLERRGERRKVADQTRQRQVDINRSEAIRLFGRIPNRSEVWKKEPQTT